MNDFSNRYVLAVLGLCAVIQFAVKLVLFGLSKRSLGENHLIVLVNLLSMSLTDLHCERRVQVKKLSQSAEREATVATAKSVAVDQQQVSSTRHQVTVQSTGLQKCQSLSQSEQAHRISFQESSVDGQGK